MRRQPAIREISHRKGPPEQVALRMDAAEAVQRIGLLGVFDALGDGGQAECPGQADDAGDDRMAAVVAQHVADEGHVDFHPRWTGSRFR